MLSQTIKDTFKTFKGERNLVKNDSGGQMVGVFTITGMSYLLVSLFCDLMRPLCIYICGVKFSGYAICLVSGMATNAVMASPKSFTIF